MMNGKLTLFIDQYGALYFATTLKELGYKVGSKTTPRLIYIDGAGEDTGKTFKVGYVIGKFWLTAYQPVRLPA